MTELQMTETLNRIDWKHLYEREIESHNGTRKELLNALSFINRCRDQIIGHQAEIERMRWIIGAFEKSKEQEES